MNYREKIRKAIECPQLTNSKYGELGALNIEQRRDIKRLLDELDDADNYIKRLYKENEQLKEKLNCDLHWALKYDELHQENKQLKEQRDELKILVNKIEKMRSTGCSYEQYRDYWKKVLKILDNKEG